MSQEARNHIQGQSREQNALDAKGLLPFLPWEPLSQVPKAWFAMSHSSNHAPTTQRFVFCVVLDFVKLTVNMNHHNFTAYQLDTQAHYFKS